MPSLHRLVDLAKRVPGVRPLFDVALTRVPGLWHLYRQYKHARHPVEPAPGIDLSDAALLRQKQTKLARIREVLACPACRGTEFDEQRQGVLGCKQCSRSFGRSPAAFDFLSADMQEKGKIRPTENVSANDYFDLQSSLVERPGALV